MSTAGAAKREPKDVRLAVAHSELEPLSGEPVIYMANADDYRFRIHSDFYDRLHNRLDQVRNQENDENSRQSGFFKLPNTDSEELPSRQHLADIVDIAFWASLGKEERRPTRFKIGYKAKQVAYEDGVIFSKPREYTVASIVKLAPSCGPQGHLLVAPFPDSLKIFGRAASDSSFLEVKAIDPGQLVIKAGTWNIAAISGSEVIFIRDGWLGIYGEIWKTLGQSKVNDNDSEVDTRRSVLKDVAREMRRLGHGGAVIITPIDIRWRDCVSEIAYEPISQLGALRSGLDLQAKLIKMTGQDAWHHWHYVEAGISDLVALTQIDGAVLLRPDLSLIGFGVKLKPGDQNPFAEVYEIDPLEHNESQTPRKVMSVGGNRHQSAARFVQDNPGALAIVVSEDGMISCFASQSINGVEKVVRYKLLELTLF